MERGEGYFWFLGGLEEQKASMCCWHSEDKHWMQHGSFCGTRIPVDADSETDYVELGQ